MASLSALYLKQCWDNLCKNEFDYYRKRKKPHPLFLEHNIDAIPFDHPDIDEWRNNFKGIRYINKDKGYNFGGTVDDVWVKPNGELIIVDVKSTTKTNLIEDMESMGVPKRLQKAVRDVPVVISAKWFEVDNTAYLVYYNGLKNEPFFNQELKFELHMIKLDCDDSWVEEAVESAVDLLDSDEFQGRSKLRFVII